MVFVELLQEVSDSILWRHYSGLVEEHQAPIREVGDGELLPDLLELFGVVLRG